MFADYLILRFCTTREIRELNRAQTFLVLQYPLLALDVALVAQGDDEDL